MENQIYNLWYHNVKIPYSIKLQLYKEGFNSKSLYNYNIKDYITIGIDILTANKFESMKNIEIYKSTVEYLNNENVNYLPLTSSKYPQSLKEIPNPPLGIFIKGELPSTELSLSIVGSRNPSQYGKTVAYKFSYELSSKGLTIISGLAKGIDTCAHQGAIDSNSKTIAVLGSGFKKIYPKSNTSIAKQIENNGCLISEYMPDTDPYSYNFPLRNRIISGLSKNVFVIEAGLKSGSLITASHALDQGKDVFAIPGNIFSPNSNGTNKLIKDGAKIICDIDDIIEEYNLTTTNNTFYDNLSDIEKNIIKIIHNNIISLEGLHNRCNFDTSLLISTLSKLECKGIIKNKFGNYFITN